ncbi:hypothetical protein TRIATDRAFT_312962 [Trichoderma atroviride IMI 206040]|uniref:Uncharacterized protein n=2 Tax=Hypocrea atroviridis TaxID=63577 RepID=G9PAK5_HYPAI|nr:uncharacterized protein TRIATDRAFT_312962 [Trichoderma atroviride IMI 206040]EHK40038.1 hypothetical protein TRIATDRAFT_312962 [Trichoderma atroviride IMI 206040]
MVRGVNHYRSFRESRICYADLGASGQPANRLEQLLPPLQFNQNGEVILIPGEIFCRYRDDNNRLCQFRLQQHKMAGGIRKHYIIYHLLPVERRSKSHERKHFTEQARRWYDEVVRGNFPLWVPRDADDTPIKNISLPLSLNDEANEEQ